VGPVGLGTDGDEVLTAQCPGPHAQVSGGVLHLDRELLFGGEVVADRREPGRRAAAASGGVQDQIGVEGLLDAVGATQDPHAGDAVPGYRGDEPDDVAPVDDLDRGQRPDPGTHLTFQVGPAGLAGDGFWWVALEAEPMATGREANLSKVPDHRCAARGEVVEQPGEQLVEDLCPLCEQHVGVSTLGYAPTILSRHRERVALDHGDPPVCVGQHPGGEQPSQACPEDDHVVTDPPHPAPPVSCQVLRR
jgi:hypothetical protein